MVAEEYARKLREHNKYVPKELAEYMDVLSKSQNYQRLTVCLSEWLTALEMCDDLLERVQAYGIGHYIDIKEAERKLRDNWTITHKQESITARTLSHRGIFSSFFYSMSSSLSSWLRWIGIVGVIQSQVLKWAIGIYLTHPAIFIGSLMSAILLKTGTEKLEES